MYIAHSRVWIKDAKHRGTIAIVHGYGECSDIHLESAVQFSLNGFDVHLIDLRGYGSSGGFRMTCSRIHDYHYDVTALLQQCSADLPLYLYGHSMGGLTIFSYLLNNPNLTISGVILSAPFLDFSQTKQVDEGKKAMVNFLAPHLDVWYQTLHSFIGVLCESRPTNSHDYERQAHLPVVHIKSQGYAFHVS